MAGLKEVAKRAGVSIATVSRVLNEPGVVNPRTRKRVEQAIRELNYTPNRVAQRLRSSGSKKLLGLVLPDVQNPFYVDVVRGVEEVCYRSGFAVMIGNFGQREEKEKLYLDILQSETVDGLIVAPSHERDQHILKAIDNGFAVVCIDRGLSGADVDVVKVDNERGAFRAVEYLIGLGHRRIAHITGHPRIPTTTERIAGFERAMEAHGVEVIPELIRHSRSDYESGAELMGELLDAPERPTAVFTANNLLTLGALKAIHERGVCVPDELSIVGFDDMYWSDSLNPPLTAVRQSGYEIGRIASERLLDRLENPGLPGKLIVLRTELVERESCGRVHS